MSLLLWWHAGAEAAHASARLGCKYRFDNMSRDGIGVMSCNPAIGRIWKRAPCCAKIDANVDGVNGPELAE